MDTIRSFIENMFRRLPKRDDLERAKHELQSTMIEKYEDYKEEGMSEHEAVGRVISEFGDIEELLDSLGIEKPATEAEDVPVMGEDEIRTLKKRQTRHVRLIAWGVTMLIVALGIGVALSGFHAFTTTQNILLAVLLGGPVAIFSFTLFIYAGMRMSKDNEPLMNAIRIDNVVQDGLKREQDAHYRRLILHVIAGVSAFMVALAAAAVSILVFEVYYPVGASLVLAAFAVHLLIVSGMAHGFYDMLFLAVERAKSPEKKHADKVIEMVAVASFSLTIVVFLVWGFVFKNFHIAWIVFPVWVILFGAFAAVTETVLKK